MTIVKSFTEQFQRGVHQKYRQMGSKLRNMVRAKDNILGAMTTFQKSRTADPTPIECSLSDFHAGDWVDSLDDLEENPDEYKAVVRAGAYALGHKTDELIIDQFDTSTNYAGDGTDGLTKAKVLTAFEMLGEADVPDDGERYAVVGWKQWSDLLRIQEFANANYVRGDELPWRGTEAKRWLGALWFAHSGLTKTSNVRQCYWFHRTAVGHAVGSEAKTDVTWQSARRAYFINNMMRQGACLVDAAGVVSMRCLET